MRSNSVQMHFMSSPSDLSILSARVMSQKIITGDGCDSATKWFLNLDALGQTQIDAEKHHYLRNR